jgi:hypothetical protein
MNFFDLFRKSTEPRTVEPEAVLPDAVAPEAVLPPPAAAPPPTPDQVRRLLFEAVASGDEAQLERLCEEHKQLILAHGAGWLDVPESFRASPQAYEWYGNGLRAIARFCAEKVGRPEVLDQPDDRSRPAGHSQ